MVEGTVHGDALVVVDDDEKDRVVRCGGVVVVMAGRCGTGARDCGEGKNEEEDAPRDPWDRVGSAMTNDVWIFEDCGDSSFGVPTGS